MLAQQKVSTIEMVHVDSLKFAPFNPPSRTTPQAVANLKAHIDGAGKIISPIIVTVDSYVADGHRRLTAARELGWEYVPVIREDYNLPDLWCFLNGGNLSVKRRTWMQAVREGMPLDNLPELDHKLISDLIRVVGRKTFEKLSDDGHGPSIVLVAQQIAHYCGDDSDKFVKKIILWFVECGTLRDAKTAKQGGCPPEILISAIEDGRSIRQTWGLTE